MKTGILHILYLRFNVEKIDAAKNEPSPKKGSIDIWPLVLEDIKNRVEMGKKKYDTVLQSENGRDALMDAYQEAIDLVLYLRQLIAENEKQIEDTE